MLEIDTSYITRYIKKPKQLEKYQQWMGERSDRELYSIQFISLFLLIPAFSAVFATLIQTTFAIQGQLNTNIVTTLFGIFPPNAFIPLLLLLISTIILSFIAVNCISPLYWLNHSPLLSMPPDQKKNLSILVGTYICLNIITTLAPTRLITYPIAYLAGISLVVIVFDVIARLTFPRLPDWNRPKLTDVPGLK